MTLLAEYRGARADEDRSRLRRLLALRGMMASGHSQREIARQLGVSQSAVSQQLKTGPQLAQVHPETVMEAAAPILAVMAADRGFTKLAVFGSVARGGARLDSDIDLLVDAPAGTTIPQLLELRSRFEEVLGRSVDLVTYRGLKPGIDDDIRREARLL